MPASFSDVSNLNISAAFSDVSNELHFQTFSDNFNEADTGMQVRQQK